MSSARELKESSYSRTVGNSPFGIYLVRYGFLNLPSSRQKRLKLGYISPIFEDLASCADSF